MIRALRVTVFLAILAVLGFFLLSLAGGGDRFRLIGKSFQKESARLAGTADSIKKSADRIRVKARDSIDRTEGILNSLTNEGKEKENPD
jgi:hypothetical protein